MTDQFIQPPDEPKTQPGAGARSIPEMEKTEDDTVYVDPLEAE